VDAEMNQHASRAGLGGGGGGGGGWFTCAVGTVGAVGRCIVGTTSVGACQFNFFVDANRQHFHPLHPLFHSFPHAENSAAVLHQLLRVHKRIYHHARSEQPWQRFLKDVQHGPCGERKERRKEREEREERVERERERREREGGGMNIT
jgi:hypothetical protein